MRTGFLGLALVMSCAAAPYQAPNDAELQFKKMTETLAAAKPLQVEFDSIADGATVKGTFAIVEGNKLDMKVHGSTGTKKYTLSITCDGAKMNLTREETPAPPVPLEPQPEMPAPANLTANVAAALARGGAWLAQEFTDIEYRRTANPWFIERQNAKEAGRKMNDVPAPAPRDVTTLHTLSNFRTGTGGAVVYDMISREGGSTIIATVAVWIDPKTGLPAKREGSFHLLSDGKPNGPALSKWAETYRFKP